MLDTMMALLPNFLLALIVGRRVIIPNGKLFNASITITDKLATSPRRAKVGNREDPAGVQPNETHIGA